MSDIVDLLRGYHETWYGPDLTSLHSKAADEIVRLREELAQMRGHVNAWTNTALDFDDDLDRWTLRAERAEADADRLAEALAEHGDHPGSGNRCPACDALDVHDKEVEAR